MTSYEVHYWRFHLRADVTRLALVVGKAKYENVFVEVAVSAL